MSTLASVLAFVAAIVLAAGIHPPHAQASGHATGYTHFGADCIKAELGKQLDFDVPEAVASNHADCALLFDPVVRSLSADTPAFVLVAVPMPHAELSRQFATSFDPPPPRV